MIKNNVLSNELNSDQFVGRCIITVNEQLKEAFRNYLNEVLIKNPQDDFLKIEIQKLVKNIYEIDPINWEELQIYLMEFLMEHAGFSKCIRQDPPLMQEWKKRY